MYLTGEFYNRLAHYMESLELKFISLEVLNGDVYVAMYSIAGVKYHSLYLRPNRNVSVRSSTKQALNRFSITHGYTFIYAVYDSKCEHCKRRVKGEIDAHLGINKELFWYAS